MARHETAQSPCFANGQGIICAGLPRSGTLSLATALGILGVGPVQHGLLDLSTRDAYAWAHAAWCSFPYLRTTLAAPDGKLPFYLPPFDALLPWTRSDWNKFIGRYRCTTDIGSMFSEQLINAYPEARVIVVERSVDSWVRSFGDTLVYEGYYGIRGFLKRRMGPWTGFTNMAAYTDVGLGWLGVGTKAEAAETMPIRHREHYDMVRRLVPAEQRLEFDLKDGWEPLCKFLDVPVPDVPFPHVNDSATLMSILRGVDNAILASLARKLAWLLFGVGGAVFLSRAGTRPMLFDALRSCKVLS